MKFQNDLDKILKLISLKEKHGASVVEAIDKSIEWTEFFRDDSMQTLVSDNFLVITPKDAQFPVTESNLAIELSTGRVKIDTKGFFGVVMTAQTNAERMHEEQMEKTLFKLKLAGKA